MPKMPILCDPERNTEGAHALAVEGELEGKWSQAPFEDVFLPVETILHRIQRESAVPCPTGTGSLLLSALQYNTVFTEG